MKITLDLPDDLVRAVESRSASENRLLEVMLLELVRRGLSLEASPPEEARLRVQFPLVECAPAVRPEEEMTPDRLADVLIEDEIRWQARTGP